MNHRSDTQLLRLRAFLQCEDDPTFVRDTSTCADITQDWQCEEWTDDSTGVSAADACPVSCGTGCALTFDSCWNQQETCQNGGVCVNLPGVEAFFCDNCASHYGGPTCETYCGPDQECVRVRHIS